MCLSSLCLSMFLCIVVPVLCAYTTLEWLPRIHLFTIFFYCIAFWSTIMFASLCCSFILANPTVPLCARMPYLLVCHILIYLILTTASTQRIVELWLRSSGDFYRLIPKLLMSSDHMTLHPINGLKQPRRHLTSLKLDDPSWWLEFIQTISTKCLQ